MEMKEIRTLTVVHANLYLARIEIDDIISFNAEEDAVSITFIENYRYETKNYPRWKSIEPLDKDEITFFEVTYTNNETKSIGVPFKDVSPNGAYRINEKSKIFKNDIQTTIVWEKQSN